MLVVLLAIAIGLVLSEVLLQWVKPIYTTGIQSAYEYDPSLGVRLRNSVDLYRVTDHREEVHSNSLGTANFQEKFEGYPYLVFALGDSYTQGTGGPADDAYPTQLDLAVNRTPAGGYEKRFGVVNLGLAAFGGEQSYLALERYTTTLGSPAVCIYLGSDNDFDDDLLFKSGVRHRHLVRGNPRWGSLTPILAWVGNLQLVLRAKLIYSNRRLDRLRGDAQPATERSSQIEKTEGPKSVAELEWPVISRIAGFCKQHNAQFILAWSKAPTGSGSYKWLQAQASRTGIPFNDWYQRVESVSQAVPRLPIVNDHSGGHYRGWVNREIALGFAAILDSLSRSSSNRRKPPR